MLILRPDGRRRLDDLLLEALAGPDAAERRHVLLLCAGAVDPERLEPFATLNRVLGTTADRELRLVATDGWSETRWTTEVAGALDAADVEGTFELAPTLDQRRRALVQRVADGRLEVLFLERGRIRGSALTVVAPARDDGRPLPLNVKTAALELLQAARDCLVWRPKPVRELVADVREALGMPAGPVTTVAAVRRARGENVFGDDPSAVTIDRVAELLASPPPPPSPRPTSIAPARSTPPAPPKKAPATERHVVENGRCTRCGKAGAQLEESCGKAELGRMGFIELD